MECHRCNRTGISLCSNKLRHRYLPSVCPWTSSKGWSNNHHLMLELIHNTNRMAMFRYLLHNTVRIPKEWWTTSKCLLNIKDNLCSTNNFKGWINKFPTINHNNNNNKFYHLDLFRTKMGIITLCRVSIHLLGWHLNKT
jgi:hypothetical protein